MGVLKNLYDLREKEQIQTETDAAVAEFLAKGGQITVVKNRKGKQPLTANGKNSSNVFYSVYQLW